MNIVQLPKWPALLGITLSLLTTTLSPATRSVYAADDLVYVQTRSAAVLSEPKPLSRVQKKLAYGDSLLVVSKDNGWFRVRSTDRTEGYIHSSAISPRRLTLTGTKKGTHASLTPTLAWPEKVSALRLKNNSQHRTVH